MENGDRLEGKTILTQGTGGVSCFAIQVQLIRAWLFSLAANSYRSRRLSVRQLLQPRPQTKNLPLLKNSVQHTASTMQQTPTGTKRYSVLQKAKESIKS